MVDNRFRMRAAAFMNLAQQIGEDNAEAGDFGFQRLKDQGLAWVLSRQFVTFHQLPKFKETVKLQTWHRGVEGPFYIRDYRMYAQDGTLLVESSSSWVVLNLESRAMILPQSLGNCYSDS